MVELYNTITVCSCVVFIKVDALDAMRLSRFDGLRWSGDDGWWVVCAREVAIEELMEGWRERGSLTSRERRGWVCTVSSGRVYRIDRP